MGGKWIDGVMQIDSEVGHYWLHWMQRAVKEGAISPNTLALSWPNTIANFRGGNAAMAMISRNVFLGDIAPELQYGEQWEVNPEPFFTPGNEADGRYVTNGWSYIVSAGTKHPCEVGLLLQYLADDSQAISVAKRYQPVSNTRVMESKDYLTVAPWGVELNKAWGKLEVLPFHANQVAMDKVIREAMQDAIANPDADFVDIARRYQAKLQKLADKVK